MAHESSFPARAAARLVPTRFSIWLRSTLQRRNEPAHRWPTNVHYSLHRLQQLVTERVSPHVLRHTTAMELMQAGVDRTLIALWLGHESVETTQIYLDANLSIKEEILSKTTPINTKAARYQPDDDLLAFLKGL